MKIEREKFVAALERVKPALEKKDTNIPALKHVWLDGKYMYACNLALGIRLKWPTELKPCGLPGVVLLGLLQNTTVKEVEVNQETPTQLDLRMGRGSASCSAMAIDGNPWKYGKVPSGAVGKRTLLLTAELIEGLRLARIIEAKNKTNHAHHGVILFPQKAGMALYSTDSKTLVEVVVDNKLDKDLAKVILPHEFVDELLKLPAGTEVDFLQDSIIAEAEGVQICSNLLDSTEVWDIPNVVDKTLTNAGSDYPLPKNFGQSLERASVLAGGSNLDDQFVTLTVGKNELLLTGNFTFGRLKDRFVFEGDLEEASVTVGLERLKDLSKEAETFTIVEKALVLYGKGDSLFLIAAKG